MDHEKSRESMRNDYKKEWSKQNKERLTVWFNKPDGVLLNMDKAAKSRGLRVTELARLYILEGLHKDLKKMGE